MQLVRCCAEEGGVAPHPDALSPLPVELTGLQGRGGFSCLPITIVHNLLDEVHNFWHILADPGQDIRRENLWGQNLSTFSRPV